MSGRGADRIAVSARTVTAAGGGRAASASGAGPGSSVGGGLRVRFCGVRGSTPTPGAEFVRVGGHTSCVAVWPAGAAAPRLVLDAGTGIRGVTALLAGAPFRGTILLTHLHWDHVQGLPFFTAADRDDAEVRMLVPDEGVPAVEALARGMSPPHFPIGPEGLRGRWRFERLDEGWHDLEGLAVLAREVPHKGGRTFGYRVEGPRGSVAYVPDHRPATDPPTPGAEELGGVDELARGVDVLIHDAQFTAVEAALAEAYGHATVDQALALAAAAEVGELVLFHHSPARTDEAAAELLAAATARAPCPVRLATEGAELQIGGDRGPDGQPPTREVSKPART